MRSYPWYLKLDCTAASMSPKEVVDRLQEIADHLGITCLGEVNDREWICFPNGDPQRLPKVGINGDSDREENIVRGPGS